MSVSKAGVIEIAVHDVKIGVRRRQKPGNIAALARSIETHGLIHPILIRGNNELVSGWRRLKAYEHLGRDRIPARRVDALSDDELRAIELEENTAREALQDYEASRQRLREIRRAEAEARLEAAGQLRLREKQN